MKTPVKRLLCKSLLPIVLMQAVVGVAQDRAIMRDMNALSSPAIWQSYVSAELEREMKQRASKRERLEHVSTARETWEKAAVPQERQRRVEPGGAPAVAEAVLPAATRRGIHRAALLSVYDADNNGVLNDSELALLTSDRSRMMSPPASASAAASRWRRLAERVRGNPLLDEAERMRLGEIFQHQVGRAQSELGKEGEKQ